MNLTQKKIIRIKYDGGSIQINKGYSQAQGLLIWEFTKILRSYFSIGFRVYTLERTVPNSLLSPEMAASEGACLNHVSRESPDIKRLAQFYTEVCFLGVFCFVLLNLVIVFDGYGSCVSAGIRV